jgi:hypothetical protein
MNVSFSEQNWRVFLEEISCEEYAKSVFGGQ